MIRTIQPPSIVRAREQERLYDSLNYNCSHAEEGGGVAGGHHDVQLWPVTLSVPSQLLEVEEGAGRGEEVETRGSDCDDMSWLVPLGNVCV